MGWHFGSRFPGDPARLVVYDFLPDTLLAQVENRAEFLGMLVFDQWMGNADSRQAIFFRARLREWLPAHEAHPQRLGFVAQMVDHGFAFDGPHWRFGDSPCKVCISARWSTKACAAWTTFSPGWTASCIFRRRWWIRRSSKSRRLGWRATKTP